MVTVAKGLDAPIKVGYQTLSMSIPLISLSWAGPRAEEPHRHVRGIQHAGSRRHVSVAGQTFARLRSPALRSPAHPLSVVPGIVISLALRYDYANFVTRTLKRNPDATPTKDKAYSKPYFWTVMTAYVGGLVTTMAVMHTFQKPQPALLYLSPACSKPVAECRLPLSC